MELYIYAKSGHNFGLESVRRCSAIYKKFKNTLPLLTTADYRAASFAKAELGVKKGAGVDVIENLPNMMKRRDILIFDSDEPSDIMLKHMDDFCEILVEVGKDIPKDIVDNEFFTPIQIQREKGYFFADDDYEDELTPFFESSKQTNIPMLLGHYMFLGSEDKFEPYFSEFFEDEMYAEFIKSTKYLLTSSVHAALESHASGNNPIFYARDIKLYKGELELLTKYNIPIIEGKNLDELMENFDKKIVEYPTLNPIYPIDIDSVVSDIESTIKKFEAMIQ